jgi:hypothetical protein
MASRPRRAVAPTRTTRPVRRRARAGARGLRAQGAVVGFRSWSGCGARRRGRREMRAARSGVGWARVPSGSRSRARAREAPPIPADEGFAAPCRGRSHSRDSRTSPWSRGRVALLVLRARARRRRSRAGTTTARCGCFSASAGFAGPAVMRHAHPSNRLARRCEPLSLASLRARCKIGAARDVSALRASRVCDLRSLSRGPAGARSRARRASAHAPDRRAASTVFLQRALPGACPRFSWRPGTRVGTICRGEMAKPLVGAGCASAPVVLNASERLSRVPP